MKTNAYISFVFLLVSLVGRSQTNEIEMLHRKALSSTGIEQVNFYVDASLASVQEGPSRTTHLLGADRYRRASRRGPAGWRNGVVLDRTAR